MWVPGVCRVLQITELVRECLQQRDANCTIMPAPPETCDLDSTATILQRCACKDATSASPLRKILSSKRKGSSSGSLDVSSEADEYGCPENVQVWAAAHILPTHTWMLLAGSPHAMMRKMRGSI